MKNIKTENDETRPMRMDSPQIIYEYIVEWKIYDITGEKDRNGKYFQTKTEAEEFAKKIKRKTPKNMNAIVLVRKLSNNEVIMRMKKSGNVNYKEVKIMRRKNNAKTTNTRQK